MARATTGTVKARGRAAGQIRLAATPTVKTQASSKEELRARIEKLERANANLRIKNKEFRRQAEEAAERLEAIQSELENNDRRAARGVKRDGAPPADNATP